MFAIVLGVVMAIFIPSQKNLLIIYGVGGTIDYLKENKDANKIPDIGETLRPAIFYLGRWHEKMW